MKVDYITLPPSFSIVCNGHMLGPKIAINHPDVVDMYTVGSSTTMDFVIVQTVDRRMHLVPFTMCLVSMSIGESDPEKEGVVLDFSKESKLSVVRTDEPDANLPRTKEVKPETKPVAKKKVVKKKVTKKKPTTKSGV